MKTALITALAAAGLLTCACSAPAATPAPHVTVTVTATHSAPAQPAPAAAAATPSGQQAGAQPTAPPSSAPPAGGQATAVQAATTPAPCLTRYLGATVGLTQGTTSRTYVVLDLKNLNNYPCTLYGYPGVSVGGGVPVQQIGLAAIEDPRTPRELVTLAPHATANALLQIAHTAAFPASACHPVTAHWLIIYPPNQTVPIYIGYSTPACSESIPFLAIDAVRPGSGG